MLIVGGFMIGIAVVAVLAIMAYALLTADDGEPAAQAAQPTATATPTPVVTRTPVVALTPSPPPLAPTATPEPTRQPTEEPPPPPPIEDQPPPMEEAPPPPPPTEEPAPPTEQPPPSPAVQQATPPPPAPCPSEAPVLVWGQVCLPENYGEYPVWAVDQVTFWFFALMGLVPSALDVAINRQVCSAGPDVPRYWRVKCTDTGAEYLVAHDGTLDVQPANDVAVALVAAILAGPAPPSSLDCRSLEGAIVVAQDGQYLGVVTCNKYDVDGIFNKYGSYGSKYSSTSIWNKYGSYGGKYSPDSPFNKYSLSPPQIVGTSGFVAYLSVNRYVGAAVVDPLDLVLCCFGDDQSDAEYWLELIP